MLRLLGPATEGAAFSIEWRRIFNNEEQIIQDGVAGENRGPGVVLGYELHQSILSVDSEDVGPVSSYWCQVRVNGDLLQRSNMLFLSPEETYPPGAAACSITESADTSKCADLPPGSQPTPPPLGTSIQGAMPTVNLQPTPTPLGMEDDPGDDNSSVQQDLYIVVGVVAVFAIIIVTLIVTIVILYHKKVARVSFKTEGESVGCCGRTAGMTAAGMTAAAVHSWFCSHCFHHNLRSLMYTPAMRAQCRLHAVHV